MEKNKCTVIKTDDKIALELMHEAAEMEKIRMQERVNNENQHPSNDDCFASALRGSKVFLEAQGYDLTKIGNSKCTVIKTDDKVALELMHEAAEMEKIRMQERINNENQHPSNDDCFASALRGSKVFLKEQGHGQKILKKLK